MDVYTVKTICNGVDYSTVSYDGSLNFELRVESELTKLHFKLME